MPHQLHRLAFLSTHTSLLAQPGTTKAGGMNVYIRELTRELGRLGYQVDIYTRCDNPQTAETITCAENVRLITLPAGPAAPLSPPEIQPLLPAFTDAVRRFARRHGHTYDLIHSHYWLSGLSGADLAAEWGCPHVAMFHTLGAVKNRARRGEQESQARIEAERRIVQRAHHLICATPHERDFLADLYGAQPDCVTVVPGGVDRILFQPGPRAQARAQLGLGDGPILLVVGRLEPLKGVDIALRAAALADVDTPLTVLIVGGDEQADGQRAQLEALGRSLGIADRVRFPGAVAHKTLPLYYRAADICVVPSYYESFGLVAVEALACGTPVVATRVGGLQYTVRDGQTGYLVPWRCPEPFAERIEALLANPDLCRRFGDAAPASVAAFEWRAVADRIGAVYERLLAGHDAQPCCGGHHVHRLAARAAACCHAH